MLSVNSIGFCLLAYAGFVESGTYIPSHSKFYFEHGVFSAASNRKLRINAKGGGMKPGDPLILWPCAAHSHEHFMYEDGLIKLPQSSNLCLNAEGGAQSGVSTNISIFPCESGGQRARGEDFVLESNGRITAKSARDMCLNVAGGVIRIGSKILLYPCSSTPLDHELFVFDGGMIKPKSNKDLHFNVEGGEMKTGARLVLWGCQAAAHEVFDFTADGRLRLAANTQMCVNAEDGLGVGHRIVIWPCHEQVVDHEMWEYVPSSRIIRSVANPELGFNIKQADIVAGSEIVLWTLEHAEL